MRKTPRARVSLAVAVALFVPLLAAIPAGFASDAVEGSGADQHVDPDWVKTFDPDVAVESAAVSGTESEVLRDSGFEAGFPNPFWTSSSANVATNICSVAMCGNGGGTALPRSGDWWAWFGGHLGEESATVTQSVTIPRGEATLSFYLWMGLIASTGSLTVDIDGDVVFTATHADVGVYGGAYRLVEIDVSAHADSRAHTLRFTGQNDTLLNNISVDDVSLTVDELFIDDNGNTFEADIEWLAGEGITRGCNPPTNDRYCPDSNVTRGQMAAFLVRALKLPAAPSAGFVDTVGTTFEQDIDRLAAAGITKGCNPPANDRFCPDDNVRREVMAAFLVRALGYNDDGGGGLFDDTTGSIFATDIDKLATAGVTKGCNPPTNNRFCPKSNVTRGQMAAFLHRALG